MYSITSGCLVTRDHTQAACLTLHRSQPQVKLAIQGAVQLSGPIDVLICNAGSAQPGYFHDQDVEIFASAMKLNYMGIVNTVKAAYDDMVRRGTGQICLVASTMSLMGFVGYASYAPTKWAVRGLADCLRNEVRTQLWSCEQDSYAAMYSLTVCMQ
jgi:short-subunit dehydrogenase